MLRETLILVVLAGATLPVVAQKKLTAESLGGVSLKSRGDIVIRNDSGSVSAYEVSGDLERVLVRVQSKKIRTRHFGPQLFDSRGRLSSMVPRNIAKHIYQASREHGIDPRLVAAVAYRESSFRPQLVSRAGACGVMQLMPETARDLGVTEIFDIEQNIDGGVRYLRMLIDVFEGDLDLVLAAYNAGPGTVERYRGIPPYRETVNYVRNVRSDYERALKRSS